MTTQPKTPIGWKEVKLCEICDVKGGKRIPKGFSLTTENTGYPYITVSDMDNGSVSLNKIRYVPIEIVDQIKAYKITTDDLFISVAGTLGVVGKIPDCLNNANLTENADKLTNLKINQDLLLNYLKSRKFQIEVEKDRTTNAQPKLAIERIKKFKFTVPIKKEEQDRIVEVLEAWDRYLENLDKKIKIKKNIKKGLMCDLLTGRNRFKEFIDEIKLVNLGDVSKMSSGGTPKSTISEYYGGSIPWVSIADMTLNGKYINKTKKYLSEKGLKSCAARIYPKGTILYAMYASIGECSIAEVETTSSQAILGIRPDENKLNSLFLFHYLTFFKEKIKLQGQQGTQSNLNAGMVKSFQIRLPNLKEQQKIIDLLSVVDKEIETLEKQREIIKNQKKFLLNNLITGAIRLPEFVNKK